MEHLELPSFSQWEDRRNWFESHIFRYEEAGSYSVGEQASALISEVQCCFCAGAWVAVVITAQAVMEANLKEVNNIAGHKRAVDLFKENGFGSLEFCNIRQRRNSLVHAKPGNLALTIDEQWDNREELETEARRVVELMFQVFYTEVST